MAKRKREPLPNLGSPSATSLASGSGNHDDGQRAEVIVQLAEDGSRIWNSKLSKFESLVKPLPFTDGKLESNKTLDQWIPNIIDHLQLKETPKQLRLAHVREGGREVDIWDDFDFSAFKSRGAAQQHPLVLKVYTPTSSTTGQVNGDVVSKKSTGEPVASKKVSSEGLIALPASIAEKGEGDGKDKTPLGTKENQPKVISQVAKPTKRKRELIPSATHSPDRPLSSTMTVTLPDGNKSPSPQPKKKRKRGSKLLGSTPSPILTMSPTPTSVANSQAPFGSAGFVNRYKPAKPSPLGKNENQNVLEESAGRTEGNQEAVKEEGKKIRKPRKKKERKSEMFAPTPVKKSRGHGVAEGIMRQYREKLGTEEVQANDDVNETVETQTVMETKDSSKDTLKEKEQVLERVQGRLSQHVPETAISLSALAENSSSALPQSPTPSQISETPKRAKSATKAPKTPKVNTALEIMRKHREKMAAEEAAKDSASQVDGELASTLILDVDAPAPFLCSTATEFEPTLTMATTHDNIRAMTPASTQSPSQEMTARNTKSSTKGKAAPRASTALEIMRQYRERHATDQVQKTAKRNEENTMTERSGEQEQEIKQPGVDQRKEAHESESVLLKDIQPTEASPINATLSNPTIASAMLDNLTTPDTPTTPVAAQQNQTKTAASDVFEIAPGSNKKKRGRPSVTQEIMRKHREKIAAEEEIRRKEQEKDKENKQVDERSEEKQQQAVIPEPSKVTQTKEYSSCTICQGSFHPQKECPAVKAGTVRLKEILDERKKNGSSEKGLESIQMWIGRLTRIENAVMGKGSVGTPIKEKDILQQSVFPIHNCTASPLESSSTKSSVSPSRPVSVPSPMLQSPYPPIYHKALSKKSGSVSGLSVSDAVIETGSSSSESSDGEDEAEDEFDSDATTESESGSISQNEKEGTAASSVSPRLPSCSLSPLRPPPLELDPQAALHHFLKVPLSQKQRRAARESAAHMQVMTMEEAIEASDIDDEEQTNISFNKERGGGDDESSLGEFEDDEKEEDIVSDDEDQVLNISQTGKISIAHMKGVIEEQNGQINEFIENNLPEQSNEQQDDARSGTHAQEANHLEPAEVGLRAITPEPLSQLSNADNTRQSFNDMAVSSPVGPSEELPGDISMREAIEEDELPVQEAMRNDLENGDKVQHVAVHDLMLPPYSAIDASDMEPLPATQVLLPQPEESEEVQSVSMRRETVRRSTRQTSTQSPAPLVSKPQEPSLTSTLETSLSSSPRRRLRSVSHEFTASPTPVSRQIMTQTSTQERAATSPQPPVRRFSKRIISSQSNASQSSQRELSPVHSNTPLPARHSSKRQTTPLLHSYQIDELDPSSPPAAQQPPVESPLFIPETQILHAPSQTDTQSQPQSLNRERFWKYPKNDDNPLFMSQGSQIAQTQMYDVYPNLDSSFDMSKSPRAKEDAVESSPIYRTNDQRGALSRISSPVIEEDDAELGDAEEQGTTSGSETGKYKSVNGSEMSEDDEPIMPIKISRSKSQSIYQSLLPSQPPPATQTRSFPTLSSLPKEALRQLKSTFGFTGSQPEPVKVNGHAPREESDSDTSADSSDEEPPASLKGRFAGVNVKKAKNMGPTKGW
ncbi:hypothetical protein L204_100627 [Cryptococcus depauperatus]|nr:hypothetical protein L204_01443 [Cryptococcus depauperatus CBS 7855]